VVLSTDVDPTTPEVVAASPDAENPGSLVVSEEDDASPETGTSTALPQDAAETSSTNPILPSVIPKF
jgi:hypothetical protein